MADHPFSGERREDSEPMERYDPKKDPKSDFTYNVVPFHNPTAEVNLGFHGTARQIKGDQLRPDIGRQNPRFEFSGKRHVNYWSTPNAGATPEAEERAWEWASPAFHEKAEDHPDDPSFGRSRVVQVRARGLPGVDANLASVWESNNLSKIDKAMPVAATHADVENTLWTPPPNAQAAKAGRGVQGTIPGLNWNQFGAPNVGNPEDALDGYSAGNEATMTAYHQDRADKDYAEAQARTRESWNPEPQKQVPGQGGLFDEPEGPSAYETKLKRESSFRSENMKIKKKKADAAGAAEFLATRKRD